MSIYVSSDLHLQHFNIIRYCNRPFKTAEEMDRVIIQNWNNTVSSNDTVWFLGDLCFPKQDCHKYLAQLNGKIIWIRGNHDSHLPINRDMDFMRVDNQQFVICHYPLLSWRNSCHGSIMLHGHCHGKLEKWKSEHIPNAKCFDVGVDSWNFTPVKLEKIIEKASKLQSTM